MTARPLRAWPAAMAFGLALLAGAAAAQAPQADVASAASPAPQVLVLLKLPPAHYRPDAAYAGGYANSAGRAARRALALDLARTHGLSSDGDWPLPTLGLDCYVFGVPAARSTDDVVAALAKDDRVVWAQPMHLYRAQHNAAAPNDPLYAAQPAAGAWRLAALHQLATGRGVRVAVIDSGVDTAHPELIRHIEMARDLVDDRAAVPAESHGTAVAGIVAADANNRLGIAGVAPRAKLLALRACWQQGPDATLCSTLSLAKALQAALLARADVVNMSLSGPGDRLLGALIDRLQQQGSSVVAALDPGVTGGGFPASHRGVVAVADAPPAALVAPGRFVPVPQPGGGYGVVSGSSYAAAHVSGLVALLRELGAPATFTLTRGSRIDACATLQHAAGPRRADCADDLVAQP